MSEPTNVRCPSCNGNGGTMWPADLYCAKHRPAASAVEPDETGPLSVEEREALVDWITRHRAEAGAAWASRLLAAYDTVYDAAYDAVATRSPAASLGEPAERPTPTSPDLCRACGCVLDPAYARIFTFCDDCWAEKHPAPPSVSGSVPDETPATPYFGCFTGDCPHVSQAHCDAAIKAEFVAQESELTALRADRDRLREAFARYATHDPFCPRGLHGGSLDDDACECGFISVRGLADSSSPSSATLEKP